MLRKAILAAFCLSLLGPAAAVFAGDPTLVGWWWFDEGLGTLAADSSGYGNNGTLTGGATWDIGKFGKAVRFDGVDDYVTVPHKPILCVTTEVTVMAWVNTNRWEMPGQGYQGIISKSNSPRSYSLYTQAAGTLHFSTTSTATNAYVGSSSTGTVPQNQWVHVCAMVKGGNHLYYINGVAAGTNTGQGIVLPGAADTSTLVIGRTNEGPTRSWGGLIDDVRVYNRGLTQQEIQAIMTGKDLVSGLAVAPAPADRATDVPQDAALSWTAGTYAGTHDVYLEKTIADVNSASRTSPTGVLVSKGQADATFDPPGLLAFGQTYYWRIDEVNKTADNTIRKGNVWSFTVEPYGYPVTPVKATASSAQTGMGPEKTIDGSGLTGDQHGTEPTTMWMSAGVAPNWIQYEFDKVYKLNDLLVWNSNQLIESYLGFGAKKVTIETSTDGTTWKALANVPEFAKASGAPGYAANTTVNFGGIEAKFVKLTITANWGGLAPQMGLAEVRFSYVPVQARAPQPASATTGVSVGTDLNWRPGRGAASHKVFFGTDQAAVAGGTVAAKTVTEHSFSPGSLNLATTYYWRVDEVNAVTYPGDVWSFATQSYKVVDDFESYTDKAGAEVFSTWIDGFADNYKSSGSTVGLDQAVNGTFCATTIFHGGKQSMPLAYDNTKAPNFSEATWTFDAPQDWTANGIKSLSLWFQGVAGNGGQLYVKINSTKVLYEGAAADLARTAWHVWNLDLSKAGKVNSVRTLAIGIEGAGTKGTLYLDDIRLYPTVPALITPADPGTKGLVAYYKLDGDAKDSAGSHHGTLAGSPQPFTAGKLGQAFNVTADLTYITVPYAADLALNSYTVSVWVNYTDKNGNRGILGTRFNSDNTFDLKVDATRIHGDVGSGTAWLNTAADVVTAQGGAITTGVWHHILYAVEPGVTRIYLDGALASTVTYTGTPLFMKSGQELRLGCSYGTEYMRGAIDEVRLYNRALSAAEAASLAGRPGPVFQGP